MEKTGAPVGGYVAELDGLRGIAILFVMIHRLYPDAAGVPWPIEAGWIGVDLFFVISGFLIAGILVDTRNDPDYFRNFYARRVLRIFPLFYLMVGGMFIVFPLADHGAFIDQAGSPAWYLFQLGNLPESVLGHDPPYWLAPVWSLAIEEQFYLTFPLLVRAADPRRLSRWLFSFAILALATRIATTALVPDRERLQYLFTICRLDTIAAGCLLALFVRTPTFETLRFKIPRALGAVALGSLVIAVTTHLDRTTVFGRTFGYSIVAIGFSALLLLVVLHRNRPATALLRMSWLRYLGKLCFGLYLLHRPAGTIVTAVATRFGTDQASLAWLPAKIALAVCFATISWYALEQPFLRLKRKFESRRHPGLARGIAFLGIVLCFLAACHSHDHVHHHDAALVDGPFDGRIGMDASPPAPDAPPADAAVALAPVLYPEGQLHSPITDDVAAVLVSIAAQASASDQVFAKVGDSITATTSFLCCFATNAVDLGLHSDLAATRTYFRGGNAAGVSPFARVSRAATGGWTTANVLAGNPSPIDREIAAITPRYGVVMLGTNDVRYGRSADAFGSDLWAIVDKLRARGAIPILSTIPPMYSDPDTTARIPLFNRIIRGIAQGRSVPLIDLHLAFAALPHAGIGPDGIHPTAAPGGECKLDAAGLRYGYNMRNLVTLEALDRARRALSGEPLDTTAPRRQGKGSHAEPFQGELPLVDLADTRAGDSMFSSYPGCGRSAPGRETVYRLDLDTATAIDAFVVDRDSVDVDVEILSPSLTTSACVSSGDHAATAMVGPGPVFIVVDSRTSTTEGEFVLVVQAR
jgi:peptidoglycan/LPS O-acetylase OafA/YrhL